MNIDDAIRYLREENWAFDLRLDTGDDTASVSTKALTAVEALLAEVGRLREQLEGVESSMLKRLERAHDEADKHQVRALAAEGRLARVEALPNKWKSRIIGADYTGAAHELEQALAGEP